MGGGSAPHSWGSAAAVASHVARIYTYRSEAITRSKRDEARRPRGGAQHGASSVARQSVACAHIGGGAPVGYYITA